MIKRSIFIFVWICLIVAFNILSIYGFVKWIESLKTERFITIEKIQSYSIEHRCDISPYVNELVNKAYYNCKAKDDYCICDSYGPVHTESTTIEIFNCMRIELKNSKDIHFKDCYNMT